MSAYISIVLLSNVVSHHLTTRPASELTESERSGNSKMFTAYLTPSGYSVLKARFRIRPATTCKMDGALYLSSLAFCIHRISISDLDFNLERREIIFQILVRLSICSMLHSHKRDRAVAAPISILGGYLYLLGRTP